MSAESRREMPVERIFRDAGSEGQRPERSGQAEKQKRTSQQLAIASIISRVNGVMR
ncbi:MAG: hypothetical protein ACI4WS_03640 [Oscillospiraceae bacterium]